jgi:UDP-N-acetylglucosamine--N-acetylmuramyl-(pentapeptide) pyrophosphoryl-undecaprenol N-acetylglucosamine transferase
MKVLFVVTGRGIGGDAMTALNIARALEKRGVQCEFALDPTAPGLLFKKHGITWHKTSIPQAGGHAATKAKMAKAAFKTFKAVLEASRLCKKVKPDVVVGVIGGGAVVGCLGALAARRPSVGVLITPMDANICTKITTNVALPESNLFHMESGELEKLNTKKAYSPINPEVIVGDREKALKKMPEGYDPDLPTVLFSSGSTLFEKMAQGVEKLGESQIHANILVVGDPLEEDYLKYFKSERVFYLGYIDWIRDLYKLVDVAVVTDDGMMIHEAMACNIPVVALLGVKYGRYHNLAAVFKGAVLEAELENLETVLEDAFKDMDGMKLNASKYGADVLNSADDIAEMIYKKIPK